MILFVALALATHAPMPRIDAEGSSIDWLDGTVRAEHVMGPCVVTGKYTHECMVRPSARAAEFGASYLVLLRVMTLVVVEGCTGWDAIQIEPSLRKLTQGRTRTSSTQVDAETWRGDAQLVLDIDLVRTFKEACERPAPIDVPKVFTPDEERRLFEQVDEAIRSWTKCDHRATCTS